MKLRRGHCWRLRCIHEIEFNDRWQLNSAAVAAYSIRDTGVVRTRPHPARDQARPKISNPPNLLIRSWGTDACMGGMLGCSGRCWRQIGQARHGLAEVRGPIRGLTIMERPMWTKYRRPRAFAGHHRHG